MATRLMRNIEILLLLLAFTEVDAKGQPSDRMAILPGGFIKAEQTSDHHSEALGKSNSQLCKSLAKVIQEKQCVEKGVAVFFEKDANLHASQHWPVEGCNLPSPIVEASVGRAAPCSVTFAGSAQNADNIWALIPAGSLLIVPLHQAQGTNLVRSESSDDPEGFIWQVMYRVHSKRFFDSVFDKDFQENLGLPDVQFATFFSGHALLQKADWDQDVHAASGSFWELAKSAGTKSIDRYHNYSFLYHRHLDKAGNLSEPGGMMLEVRFGCERNSTDIHAGSHAGSGVDIWPHFFPHLAVHAIEKDRECFANWRPTTDAPGPAKVHIGRQSDPAVLAEVVHDTKFSRLCSVVDDGSPVAADKETMFRALFPRLQAGGLYFVEDVMSSSWNTYKVYKDLPGMKIDSKHDRSSATPVAMAAVMAAAATGLAEAPRVENVEILQQDPSPTPMAEKSFLTKLVDKFHEAVTFLSKPFVKEQPDEQWAMPVPSFRFKDKWRQELVSSFGSLVDLVECTPGICVFRHA